MWCLSHRDHKGFIVLFTFYSGCVVVNFVARKINFFFLHYVQSIRTDRLAGFDIRTLVSDYKNLVLKVVAFFNLLAKKLFIGRFVDGFFVWIVEQKFELRIYR